MTSAGVWRGESRTPICYRPAMPTKIKVTLALQAERIYTDEELAELYPEAALGDAEAAVRRTEELAARVDPVTYANILMALGGWKIHAARRNNGDCGDEWLFCGSRSVCCFCPQRCLPG